MSKHTQGKWEIENHKIRANGYSIADIHGSKTTEGMANARLIAAAPDLLEALEFFLSLPAVIATHEGSGWSADNVKKIEAARAAITKAKEQ